MQFVSDPSIAVKIQKMKQRLRWDDPAIAERGIDRTRFAIDDDSGDADEFSFLVFGDTGTGEQKYNPQRHVAEQMIPHLDSCRFVLHTGDVVYLVGSSEFYLDNPNRYYTFRYGGIDFFALDSNTFNAPQPIPQTNEGEAHRRYLSEMRDRLEKEKQQLLQDVNRLNPDNPDEEEQLHDLHAKLEQIDEITLDISKQLEMQEEPAIDLEQLYWLQQRLLASWHDPQVRGRVIFFHHPPYVTEATKWSLAQTLTVRRHLRQVFDKVADELGSLKGDRSIVDLILNGHAHCLEYIRTFDTGHADSNLNCIVCGGSGYSLRRQRQEGTDLMETFDREGQEKQTRLVARSQLFIGRSGHGSKKRRPYSFIRIDVQAGTPPRFVIRPFAIERFRHEWHNSELKSFVI
jgi:hypothetical protein